MAGRAVADEPAAKGAEAGAAPLRLLALVAERTANMVIISDADRRILWVNPAFEARSGYRLAEVRGRRPDEVLNGPSTDPAVIAAIAAAQAEGRPVAAELVNRSRDGRDYWVRIDLQPHRGDDGRLAGFVSVETDITALRAREAEHRALEEERRLAREALAGAVEALPDAFAAFDADERLVAWNARYLAACPGREALLRPGRRLAEIMQATVAAGMIPAARADPAGWIAARLASFRAAEGAQEIELDDGTWLRVIERRTPDGGIVTLRTDITGMKRQARALRAAQAALEATLGAIPDLLFEVDAGGRYLGFHGGDRSRLYLTPEEFLGRTIADIMPPEVAAVQLAAIAEAAATGRSTGRQYRFDPGDGPGWFELSVARRPGEAGEAGRFLLLVRDITARKEAETLLVQQKALLHAANNRLKRALADRDAARQRFSDVAEVGSDWVWETDRELRLSFMSDSFARITGVHPSRLLGRRLREVVAADPASTASADWRIVDDAVASRRPFGDFVYLSPMTTARELWVRASGKPYFDADGAFAGYRGTGTDVTALKLAQTRAEAASRAKSQFLATMSHEIRTPLNGVMGMAALLAETLAEPGERRMAEAIRESGEALLTILNDVLDFSKIEAGRLELHMGEVLPAELARQVASLHGLKAGEKGIALAVTAGEGAAARLGDAHRILQILHNLVGNAVKFTERGGVTVEIGGAPGRPLTIVVADTGIGMTEAETQRIYEEFTQADSRTARRFGGTGLGLAIVRNLVTMMGGAIAAQSRPGAGTTFRVTLPLPEAPEAAAAGVAGVAAAAPAADALPAGLRILVADDNATNRLVLQTMLRRLGAEVEAVDGGRAAVAAAARGGHDALMLDIAMPDLTGPEALAAIRAAERAAGRAPVPAAAVTANAMRHQAEEYLAQGFALHLGKPVALADVRAAVAALAGGRPRPGPPVEPAAGADG